MDKTKICEAMYALPGAVVIRRRKSFLMPVLLVAAGIALLILNRSFRADLSNDLRSAIVFVGASLLLAGVAVLFARLFSAGNPYYPAGRCYLRYEELFFEIYEKTAVARCVEEGGFPGAPRETAGPRSGRDGFHVPFARRPVRGDAGLRIRRSGIQAIDAGADRGRNVRLMARNPLRRHPCAESRNDRLSPAGRCRSRWSENTPPQ